MARGKVAMVNGAFLLLTLPFLLRLWVEAVLWRIDRGPQMLGFSLMHGSAGVLTVPLVISWLAIYAYWLFVVAVLMLWIVPALRGRMVGISLVLLGGVGTVGIQALAAYMQSDLPIGALYTGGFLLSALVVFLVIVAIASLRLKTGARVA